MSASPAGSRPSRHTVVAFLLCLLAFSFAVEAKTAWYGPVEGHGGDVRAAKAMPADTPKLVFHGVPTPDPLHPQFSAVLMAEFAAVLLMGTAAFERLGTACGHAPVPAAHHFYPGVFFRPPPIR